MLLTFFSLANSLDIAPCSSDKPPTGLSSLGILTKPKMENESLQKVGQIFLKDEKSKIPM